MYMIGILRHLEYFSISMLLILFLITASNPGSKILTYCISFLFTVMKSGTWPRVAVLCLKNHQCLTEAISKMSYWVSDLLTEAGMGKR